MFKLIALAALVTVASAAPGYYGAPLAAPYALPHVASPYAVPHVAPWGHGYVGAPVYSAPVVKAALPVATSYANTYRVASPALVAPAPYVAAHAPLVASPYAHAW